MGGIVYTRDCDAECKAEKERMTINVQSCCSLLPELFEERRASGVLIDVRTPEEYAEGYIENSILIDFHAENFKDELKKLDKNINYSIYCRSGNRSAQALEIMEDLGFKNVYDLSGGIIAWSSVNLPIVK